MRAVPARVRIALSFLVAVAAQPMLAGQPVGVSGTAAATVKESMLGAQRYLDHVNAHGGVNGQAVEVATLDDKSDRKLTLENNRAPYQHRHRRGSGGRHQGPARRWHGRPGARLEPCPTPVRVTVLALPLLAFRSGACQRPEAGLLTR